MNGGKNMRPKSTTPCGSDYMFWDININPKIGCPTRKGSNIFVNYSLPPGRSGYALRHGGYDKSDLSASPSPTPPLLPDLSDRGTIDRGGILIQGKYLWLRNLLVSLRADYYQ